MRKKREKIYKSITEGIYQVVHSYSFLSSTPISPLPHYIFILSHTKKSRNKDISLTGNFSNDLKVSRLVGKAK